MNESVVRVPVSVQSAAVELSRSNGSSEWDNVLRDSLVEGVHDLVRKIVNSGMVQYPILQKYGREDMVSDCLARVFTQLDRYCPEMSHFSTWVWRVSTSCLIQRCRYLLRQCRNAEEFEIDGAEGFELPDKCNSNSLLLGDIKTGLCVLERNNPEKCGLLRAMFGDYNSPDWDAGHFVRPPEAARKANIDVSEAYEFYSKIVKPLFREIL